MTWSSIKRTIVTALTVVLLTANSASAQVISASNMTELKEAVLSNITGRNTSFSIDYTGDLNKFTSKVNESVRQAYSTDDYLRWSWTSISPKIVKDNEKANVTFDIGYISTKEQEEYVDSETSKIITKIVTPDMTSKQRIKAIHDYVIKTVEYDYTLQSKSAYLALTTGKTICQGYSMLVYKLCQKAEIPVHIITGDVPSGYHAWNEVEIDGNWYHIDTTFDDVKTNQYKFFCVTDEFMTKNNYAWNNKAFPAATTILKDDNAQ